MQLDKEHRSALHYQQMAEDAKTPLSVAQTEIESLKKELLVAHRHELQLNREVRKHTTLLHTFILYMLYVPYGNRINNLYVTGILILFCRRRKLCMRRRCSRRWLVAWRRRLRKPATS